MLLTNLDAMIPREDFEIEADDEYQIELIQNLPISNLQSSSPIQGLLRKPDFQRETSHWSPDQLANLITSFLDNELVPSIILWKSRRYIFVIDGSHRLSAVRSWLEDDYGDGLISRKFYGGELLKNQIATAKKSRDIIENKVGRFRDFENALKTGNFANDQQRRRTSRLFTRGFTLQWVQGTADAAETSFFKINSQGTPLDAVEETLLRNRRRPVAIAARAIIRSGTGNKYWSAFTVETQKKIEVLASELAQLLFSADAQMPVRSLDVPLGGSSSATDALSLLIDLLIIADKASAKSTLDASYRAIADDYQGDKTGATTVKVLQKTLLLTKRFTGNESASLGLHPAVYFYNDRGRHSRFLFLGMALLLSEMLKNNDKTFFRRFKNVGQS